jgi:hypothetical protein
MPSHASNGSEFASFSSTICPVRTYSIAKLFVVLRARHWAGSISIGAPLLAEEASWQTAVQLRNRTRRTQAGLRRTRLVGTLH